ncbi:hypothetical protein AKO1_002698 [Acrasis kona]|uniref:Uncharacterized protein n=1 Tax=Acrasis kona TaxID=1008807 RepID=A0AAW2ZJ14_9EUKA
MKAVTEWLQEHNRGESKLSDEDLTKLKGFVYDMVTANTEVKFEAAWIDFKVEFPSVVPYFEKQWILPKYSELDPFYYHWCRINRRTSYGLWWVNNFIENKIRMWTALKVHANKLSGG